MIGIIRKISWVLSLLTLIYGFLPVQIPLKWNEEIGKNAIYGHILQSTGGDFFVKKETIKSNLVESGIPIHEINITGNTPLTKYNYRQNYEILVSDFILIGKVIGTETEEGLGTFYVFEVDSFHLASYIPRIWNSALTLLLCGIAVIIFPILSIVQLISIMTKRKNRIYNEA